MLRKLTAIGYTAALATTPAWLSACSTPPAAQGPDDPSVLFSLSAQRMHFEDPQGMDVTLVMEGVDPSAIWFTDRPARESGAITTERLAAEWNEGETFAADPPNAALILHEPVSVDRGKTETLVAEIQSADYDATAATLRAKIRVLTEPEAASAGGHLSAHGDRHDAAWPSEAGAVSLFIDSVTVDAVSGSPRPVTGSASAGTSAAPGVHPKITLCSSPSTCKGSSTENYTYNSTIYFVTTITET